MSTTESTPLEIVVGAVLYGVITIGTAYIGAKVMEKYVDMKLAKLEKK